MAEESSTKSTNRLIQVLKEGNAEIAGSIKETAGDTFKPFVDQLKAPLNNIKAGIETLPGSKTFMKLGSVITKPFKSSASADKEDVVRDKITADGNKTLMEDIRDGILGIQDGLVKGLAGLKDKGLMGLGILAGLVAAPFVAIGAFFTQLALEVKALDKIMKGGLSKTFAPIKAFFNNLGTKFKATGLGKTIDTFLDTVKNLFKVGDVKGFKGLAMFEDLQKTFGRATRPIIKIVDGLKSFGRNVKSIFGSIKTGLSTMKGFMAGFKPIMDFAKGLGTTLGKIFLPITFLMTIFDFVTGFMDGYKEDGVFGGIKEGLAKVFEGLIGMPLDLLKRGVAWILGMFGFDSAVKTLESFSFTEIIGDLVRFPFDMIKKAVAWVGTLFTDPVTALTQLWNGIVGEGGLIDLLFSPIDMAINWVMGLFSWGDPETEFSLLSNVTNAFSSAVAWVKDLFSWPEDGNVGTAVSKFIDIVLAPYNLAINWLMGLFGFTPADLGQEGESFSIGKMVMDAVKKIFDWFAGLLDFDFTSLVKSIPGAGKVLDFLGFGEESNEEALANKQKEVDKMSADVAKESWYESKAQIEADRESLKQAMAELEMMKMQMNGGGGEPIIINNNNTDNSNSSSHTQPVAMVDTSPPTGTQAQPSF